MALRDTFMKEEPFYLRRNTPFLKRKIDHEKGPYATNLENARKRFEDQLIANNQKNKRHSEEYQHYMEEAQELSNHIAIMDHGHLIGQGTHDDLVQLVGEQDRVILRLSEPADSLLDQWRIIEGVNQITAEDGLISLLTGDSNAILPQLFELAASADIRVTSVEIQEPNLETVFLHLTGRALRD